MQQGAFPPPYSQPPPVIITADPVGGTLCPACGHHSLSIPRRRMGVAACAWCWFLLFTTGIFFVIPMCSDSCKDIEQLCQRCGAVKSVIPGRCC